MKHTLAIVYFLIIIPFSNTLDAQVIYTDIIPDVTPRVSYPLDLNNDSTIDFLIQMGASNKVVCLPQDSNAFAGELVGANYLPWALSTSDTICPSTITWYGANFLGLLSSGTSTGHWAGQTDKYLALKLKVGSSTFYGWARLDMFAGSTSFTVKDYAYQNMPDTCIIVGQGPSLIDEHTNNSIIHIYPNPFSYSTTLQTNVSFHHATLTIYNCFGMKIKETKNISGNSFTLFRENLPNGIYFVSLIDVKGLFYFRKMIISE